MALQKAPININFASGLETKTDKNQVPLGKFLALQNSVFDTVGRLTKRNGNAHITTLPNADQTTLTTLNDNLLATGSNLYAFSADTNQWLNQGPVQPVRLDVAPLVRVSTSQQSQDSVTAANGLVCLVYIDNSLAYYQISDSVTGQQIVKRTALPSTAVSPRTFLFGNYFVISYIDTSGSASLKALAISTAMPSVFGTVTVGTVTSSTFQGYDAVAYGDNLYFAWAATSTSINIAYLNPSFAVSAPVTLAAHTASLMSVTADSSTNVIWLTFWDSGTTNGFVTAYSQILAPIAATTHQIITSASINQLTSVAANGTLTVIYDVANNYGGAIGAVPTDFLDIVTVPQAGSPSSATTILRSVGLASKAFIAPSGTIYMLVAYTSANQPSYFLIDSTGAVSMRLAYSNGGGYIVGQVLPSVSLLNDTYQISYLIKDFLATTNKGTNNPTGTPSAAIYTQTGINLAKIAINTFGQHSSEIANTLHLTGGQLWQYDGVRPVEHGFQVWPDNVTVSPAATSGSITAGTYYYVFTYEWTDNQGNLHRSAPSIPVSQVTTGAISANTLTVPTLRLTYKVVPNPVRIVGYRWSVAQQVYYQFTSITSPVVNDPTVDYVTITDTLSDLSILGQTLLYTTGGVIEDIAAPASIASTLYKNRLFLIDAEDQNLLWYSKIVIEAVPVEMSDLFTLYVAPTTGTQGSTGPCTALAAMDDKLIVFKANAAYYVTGAGPDSTGANNDFSDPIFITSSVGCSNQDSIVLMQNGLMFQSTGKGIWLLGRDLSTQYIGAPVEQYNANVVKSAQSIPGTNQVRFILDNGITLMYDYYMGQWGTFNNINAISSTLYQGAQTYLNAQGLVYQETPGTYIDGSTPVLMSFTTAWANVAGLQGYERFYQLLLLGNYFTPFKLNVQLAYDYNPSNSQATIVTPDNFGGVWGSNSVWGSPGGWGGVGQPFEARVFPQVQKCESFQVTVNELYDPSYGTAPGQGLSLSGLNLTVGIKKGQRTSTAGRSFG